MSEDRLRNQVTKEMVFKLMRMVDSLLSIDISDREDMIDRLNDIEYNFTDFIEDLVKMHIKHGDVADLIEKYNIYRGYGERQ